MKASKYSDPKYLGQKFHKLTVDKFVGFGKGGKYIWHVKCDCGNEKDMIATEIIYGKVKSCGRCSIRESIGKRFGKLTVTKFLGVGGVNNAFKFECQCDCGNATVVSLGNLKSGNVKSCRRCNTQNMIGKRFGSLTVMEYVKGASQPMKFKCKCDCGNEVIVSGVALRSGNTTTCNHCSRYNLLGKQIGHLKIISIESEDIGKVPTFRCKCDCGNEVVRSMTSLYSSSLADNPDEVYCGECYHGLPDSYKPEIKERCLKLSGVWSSMHTRCCNANSIPFYQYGGRGIELRISQFEFVKMYYLENIDNMTIDRIDNNGHYEENNMRWVPQSVNNGNRVWSYDLTYNDIASRLLTITSFKSMKNVVYDNRLDFYKIVFNKNNEYGNTLNLFVHKSMKDRIHYFINRIINLFTKFGYSGELKYTHIYKVRTVSDSKYGTFSSSIDAIDTEIEYISEEEFYAH